jgi:peptide-methionine (S)-S-oxide reductase
VEFDPTQVSYESLLNVFWENHDPTQLNRQGPDFGTQYRTVIFYHSPEQQATATASKEKRQNSGAYKRPIVTQIVPAAEFWRAEEYHQQYLEKKPDGYCPNHATGVTLPADFFKSEKAARLAADAATAIREAS